MSCGDSHETTASCGPRPARRQLEAPPAPKPRRKDPCRAAAPSGVECGCTGAPSRPASATEKSGAVALGLAANPPGVEPAYGAPVFGRAPEFPYPTGPALQVLGAAVGKLRGLARMGAYLSIAPWLVEIARPEYELVREVLATERAKEQLTEGPCSTTLLSYIPFDPAEMGWEEYVRRAWGREWPDRESSKLPTASAKNDGGRDEARDVSVDGDVEVVPNSNDPFNDMLTDQFPHSTCDRVLDCWVRLPGAGLMNGAAALSTARGQPSPMVNNAGGSTNRGRGVFACSQTPGISAVQERPLLQILCDYLRGFWVQELRRRGAGAASVGISTSPVFPYRIGNNGSRETSSGWPARAGGPLGIALPRPAGFGMYSVSGPGSQWVRFGANIFVLRQSDEDFNPHNAGTQRGTLEEDAIGLALDLLRRSMPMLRGWEADLLGGGRFGFEFAGDGAAGGTADIVATGQELFTATSRKVPLSIILRSGLAPAAPDASGRGHPVNGAITLNREHDRFRRLVDALGQFRSDARAYLNTGICASFGTGTLLELAETLVRLSELILHESGHAFIFTQFGEESGVAADWYDGPEYNATAIGWNYLFPSTEATLFAPGLHTAFGTLGGAMPPVPPGPGPALLGDAGLSFPGLLALPPPLVVSRHYALTMFAGWYERLLRQNNYSLTRNQNAACRCLEVGGSGTPYAEYPGHWGWWSPNSRPCAGFTSRPCSSFPWVI